MVLTFNGRYQLEGRVLTADEAVLHELDADHRAMQALVNYYDSYRQDYDIVVPAPAGLEYLPFQKAGIHFASKHKDTLLCDEMGLGKTIQAIGLANLLKPSTIGIICPAFLKFNWEQELKTWLTYTPKVELFSYNKAGDAGAYDLLIFDEAHYLKNPEAQRTKVCLGLKADKRLFMTGTPVVNRPVDLLPMLMAMGHIKKAKGFVKRYCNPKVLYKWVKIHGRPVRIKQIDMSGSTNEEELNSFLRSTSMIRRLKDDVLDLPDKIRQIKVLGKASGRLGSDYVRDVTTLTPRTLSSKDVMSRIRHQEALDKLKYVVPFIKEVKESTDKVVVFGYHVDVLKTIAEETDALLITGSTTMNKRNEYVNTFQNTECPIIVGQLEAMGVGLTLTASSTVIFVEEDWVPARISQAEDRCYRIGQDKKVNVIHAVMDNTLDGLMAKAVLRKQRIIDKVCS